MTQASRVLAGHVLSTWPSLTRGLHLLLLASVEAPPSLWLELWTSSPGWS